MEAAAARESYSGMASSPKKEGSLRLPGARAEPVAAAGGLPGSGLREKARNPANPPIPWFPTLLGHQFRSEPLLISPLRYAQYSIISSAGAFLTLVGDISVKIAAKSPSTEGFHDAAGAHPDCCSGGRRTCSAPLVAVRHSTGWQRCSPVLLALAGWDPGKPERLSRQVGCSLLLSQGPDPGLLARGAQFPG